MWTRDAAIIAHPLCSAEAPGIFPSQQHTLDQQIKWPHLCNKALIQGLKQMCVSLFSEMVNVKKPLLNKMSGMQTLWHIFVKIMWQTAQHPHLAYWGLQKEIFWLFSRAFLKNSTSTVTWSEFQNGLYMRTLKKQKHRLNTVYLECITFE